jgi:U3 small nucleolar RNA-associated protein 6
VILAHPSPADLKRRLIEHLHALVHQTLPAEPGAIAFRARRHLLAYTDVASSDGPYELAGEALVDGLRAANEELLAAAEENRGVQDVYADFVAEWADKDSLDNSLVRGLHIVRIHSVLSILYPTLFRLY